MASKLLFGTSYLVASLIGSNAAAQGMQPRSGEASLSNLRYELIDLTPDDGETPWLSLSPSRHYMYGVIGPMDGGGPQQFVYEYAQLDLVQGNNWVSGYIGADGLRTSTGGADRNTDIHTQSIFDFRFSPNTRVIFTAQGQADSFVANPDSPHAYSFASLYANLYRDGVLVSSHTAVTSGHGQGANSGLLELTFRSNETEVYGDLVTEVAAWTVLSPVPEPGRVALLLSGCAVLAWGARRRQSAPVR